VIQAPDFEAGVEITGLAPVMGARGRFNELLSSWTSSFWALFLDMASPL
jgi:hypothetical protein